MFSHVSDRAEHYSGKRRQCTMITHGYRTGRHTLVDDSSHPFKEPAGSHNVGGIDLSFVFTLKPPVGHHEHISLQLCNVTAVVLVKRVWSESYSTVGQIRVHPPKFVQKSIVLHHTVKRTFISQKRSCPSSRTVETRSCDLVCLRLVQSPTDTHE